MELTVAELAIAFTLGLVIGSFLNVCIVRLPLGISVVGPRSECPNCRKLIAWYDNIPILSYFLLGARCRQCRAPISVRYPIVEAMSGILSVLNYVKFGWSLEWFVFLAFSGSLLVLTFIDLEHRILPDPITLNGIWAGVVASVWLGQPSLLAMTALRGVGLEVTNGRVLAFTGSALGLVFGGGLLWLVGEAYFRLRGVEGMGFGDVKMMAMVGAFLGLPLTLLTIMLGSLLGSTIGMTLIGFFGKSRQYELPFGTFLGIAAIVSMLYGEDMIRFYFEKFVQIGV